uniref:NB-ARC domain-containing protein n=1 Tax=Physcomitrium patens TaxID=3218 RepID=A0A2K1K2P3_PHYPA|nr:hypothetical protein PHYPA_012524 [Physcomitrium patens]
MEDITLVLFDVSTYEEVKLDGEELHKRLDHKNKDVQFKDHGLENYLSTRLESLWRIKGRIMDSLEVSSDIKSLGLKNCDDLSKLIEECWTLNPSKRPNSMNICKKITTLKNKYLVEVDVAKTPHFGVFKKKIKKREHDYEDNLMGVEQYLSNIEYLYMNGTNALYFIGMGGIEKTTLEKTTLAKITFDTMQLMFNVSCFIKINQLQKKDNGLSIIYKVLNQLNFQSKPKSLEEAQAMMKKLLMLKKFILVLDNVNDKSQINDIVLMDVLHSDKGSILIVTTQNWKVVKEYRTNFHKFDVEELDKDISLKLFTSYSCRDDELHKEINKVGKEIVRSCNGLPLSLKVLGSFLGGQRRLRC